MIIKSTPGDISSTQSPAAFRGVRSRSRGARRIRRPRWIRGTESSCEGVSDKVGQSVKEGSATT
jgi:hypothetical protein